MMILDSGLLFEPPCVLWGWRPPNADQGCIWLFGCRSKSVGACLECGL